MLLILLVFLADAYGQGCEFSAEISTNEPAKTIWSPKYPEKYDPSTTCYWYFYTDSNSKLSIDCFNVELDTADPEECTDTLSVASSVSQVSRKFCTPFKATSSKKKTLLIFKSMPQSKGGRFECTVKASVAQQCDCGWGDHADVVGGVEAGINQFPLMVAIYDFDKGSHACGGSIISRNFVLTAAHCLEGLDYKLTGLFVGRHNLSTADDTKYTRLYRAAQFIKHPDYNTKKSWNDIGLIRSETPIQYNTGVGPVCLPFNRPYMPSIDDHVTAIGWGTTSFGGPKSDVLLKTMIKVVEMSKCIDVFGESAESGKQTCTYTRGNDTCQFDSGGPLIITDHRYFLAALVSFGYKYCGGYEPAVSTRIAPYLDWIQKETGDNFCIK